MFELSGLEEIAVALGAVLVTAVLFLLWRMGFLTKKTLPWVGGALASLGALVFVRSRKRDRLRKRIAAKEEELAERERGLEKLKEAAEISDRELDEARAGLEREREEHRREVLRIEADTEEEKRRIEALPPDDLLDEFGRTFGPRGGEGRR